MSEIILPLLFSLLPLFLNWSSNPCKNFHAFCDGFHETDWLGSGYLRVPLDCSMDNNVQIHFAQMTKGSLVLVVRGKSPLWLSSC